MPSAKLFIKERATTAFVASETFHDKTDEETSQVRTGTAQAYAKGERMCVDGNVDQFEVWVLEARYERCFTVRPVGQGGE